MVAFAEPILPSVAECQDILNGLQKVASRTVGEIVEDFTSERRAVIRRGLTWMIKMGVLVIAFWPAGHPGDCQSGAFVILPRFSC